MARKIDKEFDIGNTGKKIEGEIKEMPEIKRRRQIDQLTRTM